MRAFAASTQAASVACVLTFDVPRNRSHGPGVVVAVTAASASTSQLVSSAMLASMTGVTFNSIPYKSGPAAMTDLDPQTLERLRRAHKDREGTPLRVAGACDPHFEGRQPERTDKIRQPTAACGVDHDTVEASFRIYKPVLQH